MCSSRRMVICLLCIGLVPLLFGTSQASSEGASPSIREILPSGQQLGSDWKRLDAWSVDDIPPEASNGAAALYVGPEGSRAWIFVFSVKDTGPGVIPVYNWARDGLFRDFQARSIPEWLRTEETSGKDRPDQCVGGERAEGYDFWEGLELGTSLCALGDQAVLLTAVHGQLDGRFGWDAADHLLEIVIAEYEAAEREAAARVTPAIACPPDQAPGTAVALREAQLNRDASQPTEVLARIPRGASLEITGPPTQSQMVTWYPVRDPASGEEGFVLASAIEVCGGGVVTSSTPAATPAMGEGTSEGPG